MNEKENRGRIVLLGFIWAQAILIPPTHLGLAILSGDYRTLIMFGPMNVIVVGMLIALFRSGARGLQWILFYMLLVRGGIELMVFWNIGSLQTWSEDGQRSIPILSKGAATVVQLFGVPLAATGLLCAMALAASPSVNAYLASRSGDN